MSVVRRLHGTATILCTWPGQRRALFEPREELLGRRDARVREIVRHAAERVPYYRDLFRREGIAPSEIRTADDLTRLPLLDRKDVQDEPERFLTEGLSARDLVELSSGGSSGVRVQVLHDRRSLLQNIAYSERERMVEEALAGRRYAILQVMRTASTARVLRAFYAAESFRPLRPDQHEVALTGPLETVYEEIARRRPQVLWSSGALLDQLVRDALERDRSLEPLRVLVFGGDAMSEAGRELAEHRLGLAVLAQYAAVEALKIGFLCEQRQGYHLHEDLCHVSVVGDDGRPVAGGERGEIVVSNLVNRGTVLLNYRIGDLGRLGPADCACGRTTLVLARLDGRVHEIIRLSGGRLVVPGPVEAFLSAPEEVRAYQLLQLEPDRFELRLVTADGTFDRVEEMVGRELSAMLGGARVDFVEVAEIEPASVGKYRRIVPGGP